MISKINPIAIAFGDEFADVVSRAVFQKIFGDFPFLGTDMSVQAREETNDYCVKKFIKDFFELGSAVKISTASAQSKKISGRSSANIILREETEAMYVVRLTQSTAGKYKKISGVLRLLTGDCYSERNYRRTIENGRNVAIAEHVLILDYLPKAGAKAVEIAQEYGLKINVSSKFTISKLEEDFHKGVVEKMKELGIEPKELLVDDRIAEIPHDLEGGFLDVLGNKDGDTGTDSVNRADEGYSMSSIIDCWNGLTYEELPGGTDPRQLKLHEEGEKTFHNPLPYALAFARAYKRVNPDLSQWLNDVIRVATEVFEETGEQNFSMIGSIAKEKPASQRETFSMIDNIAAKIPQIYFNLV